MEEPRSRGSLACLVLTCMGRVLVQCERDATLPFHFPRLALLLASLLQLATTRESYVALTLQNGVHVVLAVDAAASVACAVLYTTSSSSSTEKEEKEEEEEEEEEEGRGEAELARLQSLVVLHAFLSAFRSDVDRLVAANRVAAERMAEAYTLTSALSGGGGGGGGGEDDEEEEDQDGTLEMFVAFHHQFVARVLERTASGGEEEWAEEKEEKEDENDGSERVLRVCLMNGETGTLVYPSRRLPGSEAQELHAHTSQEVVRRAARALQRAFPLLLQQQRSNGVQPNAMTLVLHFHSSQNICYSVAIRMLHLGVFASIVHYYSSQNNGNECGHNCELLKNEQLQRVLTADPRGKALLRLIHDAAHSKSYALHIESGGVSSKVAELLERPLRSWQMQFDPEESKS